MTEKLNELDDWYWSELLDYLPNDIHEEVMRRVEELEDRIHAMEGDEARLNWLETEGRREDFAMLGKMPIPHSLFRSNMPITRRAIDETIAAAQEEQP